MRRFFRKFRYGEKGFTLIELLVVVAILGVLAAVAVPNVGKFLGRGHEEAKRTEAHNVQTATMAAMADAQTGNVTGSGAEPFDFGDADDDPTTFPNTDVFVATVGGNDYYVGHYIMGGVDKVQGHYQIKIDGTVDQVWYPGD